MRRKSWNRKKRKEKEKRREEKRSILKFTSITVGVGMYLYKTSPMMRNMSGRMILNVNVFGFLGTWRNLYFCMITNFCQKLCCTIFFFFFEQRMDLIWVSGLLSGTFFLLSFFFLHFFSNFWNTFCDFGEIFGWNLDRLLVFDSTLCIQAFLLKIQENFFEGCHGNKKLLNSQSLFCCINFRKAIREIYFLFCFVLFCFGIDSQDLEIWVSRKGGRGKNRREKGKGMNWAHFLNFAKGDSRRDLFQMIWWRWIQE